MVTVITVANQKGGTGKTTLSALLAYALGELDKRVLLIDLDPQSHLSTFFIKVSDLENVEGSLHMALGQHFEIKPITDELDIVPSRLDYMIRAYRGEMPLTRPHAIDERLRGLRSPTRLRREPAITRTYDYVVIDTPPELYSPTIWGLYAADYIVIPSNLEELSLMGVRLLIKDILPDVFQYSKRECKVLGIALTNVIRRYKPETMDKINDAIKKFIQRDIPMTLRDRFYARPLFKAVIHRYNELKDIVYRPKRWEIPLFRIIRMNRELYNEVVEFGKEVIDRETYFQPLT